MYTTKKLIITLMLLVMPLSAALALQPLKTDVVLTDNLFEAIKNIDIVSLNINLADGADVDTVDAEGNTPVMLAAKIGNPRIMKILLAHDPDLNHQNHDGYTALMVASEYGQQHIVEDLLIRGANPTIRNNNGLTADRLAEMNGHPAIVNILRARIDRPVSR